MSTVITLADGRKFDPIKKTYVSEAKTIDNEISEGDSNISLSNVTNKAMRLEDLPTDPKRMNAVCAVLSYKMMGLSDNEIATAFGVRVSDVVDIYNSDAYISTERLLFKNLKTKFTRDASGLINSKASDAAKKVVDLLDSKNPMVAIRAAENILDRSDVESKNSGLGMRGLQIRIVKDTNDANVEIKING